MKTKQRANITVTMTMALVDPGWKKKITTNEYKRNIIMDV